MNLIDKYILESKPFDFDHKNEEYFNKVMVESFKHHYQNSSLYKKLCKFKKISPDKINQYTEIPEIFVSALKKWEFITGSKKNVEITLSSSGTGGQKSRIFLDGKSLYRIEHIVRSIFDNMGMVTNQKNNYICFTYDPEVAHDVGTAFSDKMLTGLTGKGEVFYTMKFNKNINDFELDLNQTIKVFEKFEQQKNPLRILGFPAHLYFALCHFEKKFKRKLSLPKNSFVITGGGWKNHSGKEIPKNEFKKMLSEKLGISVENIRDHYGMVEHGIPYVDCEYGHMHVPSYSRLHTYDIYKNEINKFDKEGLLTLYTPYINSYPSIALLSSDRAIVRKDCKCGRGPWLDLKGRAGIKQHKGCAIAAIDKLRRQLDS
ncbi:MAG: hypothetical protein ACQESP_06895 [Candidatus Muiribacteriota bacterium]